MTNDQPQDLYLSVANPSERGVLDQLWTMFRHDMSAYSGALPDHLGRFRQERLDAGFHDPGWRVYILRLGTAPVGMAVVRGLNTAEHVISSFFLVNGARRAGHGRMAVRTITRATPGRWSVAFQDANLSAAAFWAAIASDADQDWTLERRAVPGRPELAPDSWASFTVRVS